MITYIDTKTGLLMVLDRDGNAWTAAEWAKMTN